MIDAAPPLPRGQAWEEAYSPQRWVFPWQPVPTFIPWRASRNRLSNRTESIPVTHSTGNSKGFRSSAPGMGMAHPGSQYTARVGVCMCVGFYSDPCLGPRLSPARKVLESHAELLADSMTQGWVTLSLPSWGEHPRWGPLAIRRHCRKARNKSHTPKWGQT